MPCREMRYNVILIPAKQKTVADYYLCYSHLISRFSFKPFAAFGAGYFYFSFASGNSKLVSAGWAGEEFVLTAAFNFLHSQKELSAERPPISDKFIVFTSAFYHISGKETEKCENQDDIRKEAQNTKSRDT
jgi:hypothetical protein